MKNKILEHRVIIIIMLLLIVTGVTEYKRIKGYVFSKKVKYHEEYLDAKVFNNMRLINADSIKISEYELIILVRFDDFSCEICFKSFMVITDSIRVHKNVEKKVLCLVERDSRGLRVQKNVLKRWAKNNLLTYTIAIVESFSSLQTITYSSILLKKGNHYQIFKLPILDYNQYKLINEWIRDASA